VSIGRSSPPPHWPFGSTVDRPGDLNQSEVFGTFSTHIEMRKET
jgi:hypothetical protein